MKHEQLSLFELDTTEYIYKSDMLIESSYSLSINAQRLLYLTAKKLKPVYISKNIKPSQLNNYLINKTFNSIRIYVSEFKKEFSLKTNSLYETLQKVTEELFNAKIRYIEGETIVEKRWVITAKYNKEGCYVEISLHPDLVLDLLVFKNRYNKLHSGMKYLKTTEQIRTYEILKRYLGVGKRYITYKEFRWKLDIEDGLYDEYAKFKQRKLKPIIEAINKHTDINIELEEIRLGRKVGAFNFYVKSNIIDKEEYCDVDEMTQDINYVEVICEIIGETISVGTVGVITDVALEGINNNKLDISVLDYIKDKVNVINEYSKYNKVSNKIGAIIHALRTNWTSNIVEPKGQNILDEIACGNIDVDDVDLDVIDFSNKGNYIGNNKKRHR